MSRSEPLTTLPPSSQPGDSASAAVADGAVHAAPLDDAILRIAEAFKDRGFLLKSVLPAMIALFLIALVWTVPQDLSDKGRIVVSVLILAIAGWTMTKIGDTIIAVAAVVTLIAADVIDSDVLYTSLGHELIWLLLAAFVIAAVFRASGLVEPLLLSGLGTSISVTRLFYSLTAAIAATALFIPSTSARAALLLPVFLELASRVRSRPIIRALALLFPTIILLSASGSLIGAGAHILAADVLAEKADRSVDYVGWLGLAMPMALLSSFVAATIILHAFLSPPLRRRRLSMTSPSRLPRDGRSYAIIATLVVTVLLWMTEPWHGVGMGVVALAGACVMLKVAGPLLRVKDAFKTVEVELIVFLAVTFTFAEAITKADVDDWLAHYFKSAVPGLFSAGEGWLMAAVALIALLSHLIITSRTARAAVLIPAIVLPLGELGADMTTLVMVTIVGTGLCQTMSASAKPVAIFSNAPIATYNSGNLLGLSMLLLPMMFALIMAFALFVWPHGSS